jgi:hypothetical protein
MGLELKVSLNYKTLIDMSTRKNSRSARKNSTRRKGTIGPLRKGELTKYGYAHVTKLSSAERHSALRKAVHEYGSLTTWRKLNAVAVYTRYTSPQSSAIFKQDMDWIRKTYGLKAN